MARLLLTRLSANRGKGFTLVELLIVVAIIGVLSTIGVPQFRKMVQKSKKAEAKVNLGGLYTAEQSFYAEYGAFGSRLAKVGFEVDGTNFMYVIGFTPATCAGFPAAIQPGATATAGTIANHISTVFPGYYDAALGTGEDARKTVTGATLPGTGCTLPATVTVLANVVDDGGEANKFMAIAAGVIAPGVSKTATTAGTTDIWTMDNARKLVNAQDGVR